MDASRERGKSLRKTQLVASEMHGMKFLLGPIQLFLLGRVDLSGREGAAERGRRLCVGSLFLGEVLRDELHSWSSTLQGLLWNRGEKASCGATVDIPSGKLSLLLCRELKNVLVVGWSTGGEQLEQSSCSLVSEKPWSLRHHLKYNQRVIESFRSEKTFKINESNQNILGSLVIGVQERASHWSAGRDRDGRVRGTSAA